MKKLIKHLAWQTLYCLLFAANLFAQVTVIVTQPADTTGACKQNQHTATFSGAAANTQLRIIPSLNVTASGTCPTTDGVAIQFVTASNATLVSDGDSLVVTINGIGNTTINYNVLIDCHIVGGNTINLNQQFNSNNATNFLVDADNIHTTTGIKKPSIVLQNVNDFKANYLTNNFFTFYYRNNGDSANIKFTFSPDTNGYCGQVTTDSVFFQNGLNGTLYPYNGLGLNTIALRFNDTLIIKQRVQIDSCITTCVADTAKFSWSCNYSASQASNFCNNCQQNYKYSYLVSNNDSAKVDVIRLSPAKALREFSCFNDTTNATLWSYIIVNTGRGAIDSLNFDFLQWNTRFNPDVLSHLMLIDSSSLHIAKGSTSTCILNTTTTTRNQWLCQNLIPNALHRMDVRIKNFGITDTIFLSFKTLRCSEENDSVLLNIPKRYNQWAFNNFRAREICGNWVDQSGSGLIGTAISGQSANSNTDDFNLKLNFFPSVSNLSVDNNGDGDSTTFSIDLKGLVKNSAFHVYQLLGCDTTIGKCDTLYGWLRTTIFCDTNIRITNPQQDVSLIKIGANNDTTWFNHEYYYTSLPVYDSVCRRNFYYYYFNLADSAMKNVLDSGQLIFKVQACCGSDLSPSPYSVTFHLLPNPNNCFTLLASNNDTLPPTVNNIKGAIQWLPLSDKKNDLAVLCPGCLSPGIISNFYKMQRTQSSMGLQDSDNDGRADIPITQITDTSAWFAQYGSNVKRNFSGFGDRVEDYLRANFVDGDASGGIGYNYAQLQAHDLRFNVLQLSRFIPVGVDTMNLTPDSLVFYIDDTTNSVNGCIDCDDYNMPPSDNTTILRLNVGPADISKFFVGSSISAEEFRFAFTSYLNGSTLSGSLHDYPSLITHTNNTFAGFMPTQHYRLRVFYSVCGNFSGGSSTSAEDFVKESKVFNRLFLSGNIKQVVSDLIPQQPNTVALLDSAGWTLDTNDIANNLVDTNFMNQYFFMCEGTGAIHYFVSTETNNGSQAFNNQGCKKILSIRSSSNIAGGKNIYDVFPNEYKTPLLMPVNFNINIPFGYYVTGAGVNNTVYFPYNGTPTSTSDTITMQLADTTGNIVLTSAQLPDLHCFTQSQTQQGNDSLFFGDQYIARGIDLYLMPIPELCIDSVTPVPFDTTCIIGFNIQAPSCLGSGQCSAGNTFYDGNNSLGGLGVNPDLVLDNINNSFALLNSDTICWRGITIENQNTTLPASTRADNVFIALIDSSPPYLSNWHFIKGGQVIQPNANVFGTANFLNKGTTVTGDLCARVASCPNDTLQRDVLIHFGWNCGGFPNPYDSMTICEFTPLPLSFKKAGTSFFSNQKYYDYPYVLCDTLRVYAPFQSTELGYIYPDSVVLPNLNPNLQIIAANIYNSNPSNNAQLIPSTSDSIWYISPDSLMSIGVLEGGINNSSSFFVEFLFLPTCAFANSVILPDFDVYAHDFCGFPDTANADFSNSPPFAMDTTQSACADCWSITKTANTDTVIATTGSVTYTIEVCNNSATTQTATVTDTPPNGFVTSSPLTANVTLASMQCSTFTVTGYFTTPGSCLYNVASVTSPATTIWKDSVCVTVLNTCANTDTTFADSTFSGITTNSTTTINGKSILVAGRYYVNNVLNLNNCTVYTAAGAQIIVQSTGTFNTNNTTIQACDTMWQGVNVLASGKMFVLNNSKIKDANNGIFANHPSTVTVDSSSILDCVIGIFAPSTNGVSTSLINVSRSEFGLQANAFKPNYTGQPAHGAIPRAGIEVHNLIMTLGGTYGKNNRFYKMNNGIIAHNTQLTVRRSQFYNIDIDSVYSDIYRGYAIVCRKSNVNDLVTARLTVLPEVSAYNTVNNCYRGIYTRGASFNVNYVHLLNVKVGMYSEAAPWLSTNTVYNCTITASNHGLFFIYNPLARFVIADYNTITINGVANPNSPFQISYYAIHMRETNPFVNVKYSASGNIINMTNAQFGIYAGVLNRASIKFNNIRFAGNGSGIAVQANYQSSISCNTIKGTYSSGSIGGSLGINSGNSSTRNLMYCNTVDSTFRGFNFGGNNDLTSFRGNEMNHHFVGLYLNTGSTNNPTYIGKQIHAGNKWNQTCLSGFGGVNLSGILFVPQSRFTINSALGSTFYPTVSPPSWFKDTLGSAFYCSNSLVCSTPPPALAQSDLEAMIENGTLESEDFSAEARAIAEEHLYRTLADDSTLWAEDSVYIQFMLENEGEPTGYLYDAEEYLRSAYEYDSVFINLIDSAYNQITLLNDSIVSLEEHQPANWETIREQLINTINFLNQTVSNINLQREALINNNLDNAEFINDLVVNGELPEINTATINDVEIEYLESGEDIEIIISRFNDVLPIAQQCPYVGGPAVERARAFVALINDTMGYNDDDVCLQSGVYRNSIPDSVQNASESKSIIVKPNPATDKIEISLVGKFEGLCKIEIINTLNKVIYKEQMSCNEKTKTLNVSTISQGIYSVNIFVNGELTLARKIAIIK